MKKKPVKKAAPKPRRSSDQRGKPMGRRLKYGEATVKVNYRVPVSKKPEVDKLFQELSEQWAVSK